MSMFSSSPMKNLVHMATDKELLDADWETNSKIWDLIKRNPVYHSEELADYLKRRLKHKNTKVVSLALILADSCIRNCGYQVYLNLGRRDVLKLIGAICEGKRGVEVSRNACSYLQQWVFGLREMQSQFPLYRRVYNELIAKGRCVFPDIRESDVSAFIDENMPLPGLPAGINPDMQMHPNMPVMMSPAAYQSYDSRSIGQQQQQQQQSHASNVGVQSMIEKMETEFDKLRKDLKKLRSVIASVEGRIEGKNLNITSGTAEDFQNDIAFLEACKPRLQDLIAAGSQGCLDEEITEDVLGLNDRMLFVLETNKLTIAEKKPDDGVDIDDIFATFDKPDDKPVQKKPISQNNVQVAADDPFLDLISPSPKPVAVTAPAKPVEVDPFLALLKGSQKTAEVSTQQEAIKASTEAPVATAVAVQQKQPIPTSSSSASPPKSSSVVNANESKSAPLSPAKGSKLDIAEVAENPFDDDDFDDFLNQHASTASSPIPPASDKNTSIPEIEGLDEILKEDM